MIGVLALIAPTTKDMNPAKVNCTMPKIADAVPEYSTKRAIARVVVFGAINPSIAMLVNIEISKSQKLGYKNALTHKIRVENNMTIKETARIF